MMSVSLATFLILLKIEYLLLLLSMEKMSFCISSQYMDNPYDNEPDMWYKKCLRYEDLKDIEKYGFARGKIIYDVKCSLNSIEYAVGRENKINMIRDMFAYLATTDCKKFLQTYGSFCDAVKKKLLEFRYKENIREAQRWWRDIFGTRIPIE